MRAVYLIAGILLIAILLETTKRAGSMFLILIVMGGLVFAHRKGVL